MVAMPKQNVPTLRLEGFNGEWSQSVLGSFARKVNEKNVDLSVAETFTNSAEKGVISQTEYFKHQVSNDMNLGGYYVVQPNDFIYNPRISTGAPVGPINRNKLERVGVVSPLYTVFRLSLIDHSFLDWFFKSPYWHGFMRENGDSGARGDRLSIGQDLFFQMPVATPPTFEEQQAIGAIFTNLDAAINQHTLKHKSLQQAKTAFMQRMFPQEGQTVPALRLEGFNGEWEVVKFGDFFRSTQLGINDLGEAGQFGTPLLKMGNIQRGYFDLDVYERLPESVSVSPEYLIYSDDFLINTRNTLELVGKGATWTGRSGVFTFNGNIARLELVGVDRRFFNYLYNLPSTIADVHKRATGTTSVAAIYPKTLESIEFLLPTLEEQQAIGAVFTQLDTLIAAEAQYIVSLKQAKTALLQRMFI